MAFTLYSMMLVRFQNYQRELISFNSSCEYGKVSRGKQVLVDIILSNSLIDTGLTPLPYVFLIFRLAVFTLEDGKIVWTDKSSDDLFVLVRKLDG